MDSKIKNSRRWEVKEAVQKLRSQGFTYSEIQKVYPLAKSTISNWCKDIDLSPRQIEKIKSRMKLDGRYDARLKGAKANKIKREKEIKKIRQKAINEIDSLTENEFKIAGCMLYWGEGNKSGSPTITNSDPELILFMVKWFERFLDIPIKQLKAYLNIHSGQNEKDIVTYWVRLLGIPSKNFGKSYIKPEGKGFKKNKLYKGTIRIRIPGPNSQNIRHKILGWKEGISKNVITKF